MVISGAWRAMLAGVSTIVLAPTTSEMFAVAVRTIVPAVVGPPAFTVMVPQFVLQFGDAHREPLDDRGRPFAGP